MITGVILTNGSPVIELKVCGVRQEVTVEGILDTGLNGFLCLPTSIAVSLGLELIDTVTAELADGTTVEDELVFAGQAEWDGTLMNIRLTLTDSEDALIGTAFPTGYRVELDYTTLRCGKVILVVEPCGDVRQANAVTGLAPRQAVARQNAQN